MKNQGLILCAKYAVAPNFFGYCGPDDNKNIVDHLKENRSDKELAYLLKDFETLYPYLQLIARENRIENPFDERVVEAYWLGNRLLEKVKAGDYLSFLEEKLALEKKIGLKKFIKVKSKISTKRFLPNHAFHVFNIFKRTGNDPNWQTISTMDQCRIGWGKIIEVQNSKFKVQSLSLNIKVNQLFLSPPIIKEINLDYNGKHFIKDFKVGDWISFHWGMICDKLTDRQVRNLEFYTKRAIDFYNQ